jgi:hypothetical protein
MEHLFQSLHGLLSAGECELGLPLVEHIQSFHSLLPVVGSVNLGWLIWNTFRASIVYYLLVGV